MEFLKDFYGGGTTDYTDLTDFIEPQIAQITRI